MADLDRQTQASQSVHITGSDEAFQADVVREDNVNKLLVKSTTVPQTAQRLIFDKFVNGGSSDLTVNGSGTPVIFQVSADLTDDKIIREIKFYAFDSGIRIDRFLGQNSLLANGVLVRFNINGNSQDFIPIRSTGEFESHFAFGSGGKFNLIFASGDDFLSATFSPIEPTVLKAGTSDNIQIIIQDNLNNISSFEAISFGLFDT